VDDARAKARAVGLTNGQAALYEGDNHELVRIAQQWLGKSLL